MKTITFKVKDESLQAFFLKNLTNAPTEKNRFGSHDPLDVHNISAYHFLRDVLIFKKDGDIKEGEQVLFELKDRAQFSQRELTSSYVYKAEKYDDVSIKLVLISHKITAK